MSKDLLYQTVSFNSPSVQMHDVASDDLDKSAECCACEGCAASDACYTTKYACIPWEKTCQSYQEEFDCMRAHDSDIFAPHSPCEKTITALTLPIVIPVAAIMSTFGFFAGLGRDVYSATKSCCVSDNVRSTSVTYSNTSTTA